MAMTNIFKNSSLHMVVMLWQTVTTSFSGAARDFRPFFSKHFHAFWGFEVLLVYLISGLLTLLVILGISSGGRSMDKACVLEDKFTLFPEKYTPWTGTGFFRITLPFWKLTFEGAKAIDILWNLLVGRGGQAVLAFLSWRAFALYVTTSMERTPVTFGTFRAIFLEDSPTITSTAQVLRDFVACKRLHSRIATTFVAMSMLFALSFPTLASAMAGYTTYVTAEIKDNANNSVVFSKFDLYLYSVHDGDRINLPKDFNVTYRTEEGDPLPNNGERRQFDDWYHYIKIYGSIPQNRNSTLGDVDLPPPTLNITVYYDSDYYGEKMNLNWLYLNDIYNKVHMEREGNGRCPPTKDYAWGFSFIQLYIVIILLLLWAIGTLIMFISARRAMLNHSRPTVDGKYRSVINLAAAMQKELHLDLHTPKDESEIETSVRDARGGSISYPKPTPIQRQSKRKGFVIWLCRKKWWLFALLEPIALVLGTLITKSVWVHSSALHPWKVLYYIPWLDYLCLASVGAIIGISLSLSISTTRGSRFVVAIVPTVIASLLAICYVFRK